MTAWLMDKSALIRWSSSLDAQLWIERAERGLLHVTTPTHLEIGYSARTVDEWDSLRTGAPAGDLVLTHLTPASERRAIEVQGLLAARGRHRAPSVADLLIAAVAETAGLTVLHVDKDFELIAEATGQSVERLRL